MNIQIQLTALACLLVGLVIVAFSTIATLQQTKTQSELIRSRLSVTVEGAARPFNTVIELGLPVSMLRNRAEVLARAHSIDSVIHDIALFNPSGTVVEHSGSTEVRNVPHEILTASRRSKDPDWSLETENHLVAGRTIFSQSGTVAGAIYARYPLTELDKLRAQFRSVIVSSSLVVFFVCGALAWITFTLVSRGSRNGALTRVRDKIARAEGLLSEVEASLDTEIPHDPAHTPVKDLPVQARAIRDTDSSRQTFRLTMAVFASLVLGALIILTTLVHHTVGESLEPELRKRAELVSHIVAQNVETAVASGIPAEAISGLEGLLAGLQNEFPEISGLRLYLNGRETALGQAAHITYSQEFTLDESTKGRIVVSSDPRTITVQFRTLFIDLAIIAIFTLLLAVEIAVLQIFRTIVSPITGLNVVAGSVLKGEFNLALSLRWPAAFASRARALSARICAIRAQLEQHAGSIPAISLPDGGSLLPPKGVLSRLQLTSLTDIRLGLFLFAVADEAPLSFFALYFQDLNNPFGFLPDEVAISLPFAGYLLAALICAPFARPLGQRIGYRTLFVIAALVTCVAKTGLYFSQDILAAVLWQSLNGAFFAFAMLACQDYALDMLPKEERVRSMAIFRAVLFSGVFAGTALGGILADRLGERPVFLFCAGLALVSMLLILTFLPRQRYRDGIQKATSDDSDRTLSLRFLLAFTDLRFCALAIGIIAPQAIIDHVFISYLLALLMGAAGASITMIAQLMMVFFLSLILSGHAAGHLQVVTRNPILVVAVTTLVSGVALWFAGQDPGVPALLIASFVAGATLGLSAGPITDIALQIAETRLASLGATNVLGMVRVLERGGAAVAMIAAGVFASFFGFGATTSAIGLYAIVAASIVLVFSARPPPRHVSEKS